MVRQRKNPESKGMEEASVKDLNEIEANNLSDTEFLKNCCKAAQRMKWQLKGTGWELQQHKKKV